jgi:hypothetical protein
MEILSVGAELFHAERRTDKHDDSGFSPFFESVKEREKTFFDLG